MRIVNIIGKQLKQNIDMELTLEKKDNIICYYLNKGKHTCIGLNIPLHLHLVEDTRNCKTLCIIYPKGKRPDLGYSVNNKK